MLKAIPVQQSSDSISAEDYDWLVHHCALLAGETEIAADLAQETLIEAWRNRHKLTDPQGLRAWLAVIARHVYHRWQRQQFRDNRLLTWIDPTNVELEHFVAQEDDLLRNLERDELATLLDRALAFLPGELRLALVAHYVDEQPQQDLAAQLGINQGTLTVRLHRGKLALRRIFATELHEDAVAFGLNASTEAEWITSRLWCPICGQAHLQVRFDMAHTHLEIACPTNGMLLDHQTPILTGARTYRAAMDRVLGWVDTYFPSAIAKREAVCISCGRMAPLRHGLPNFMNVQEIDFPSVHVDCTCWKMNTCDLPVVALASPQGRAFRQAHPRTQLIGQQQIEVAGVAAHMLSFASVTDSARLNLAFASDTYRILDIATTAGG